MEIDENVYWKKISPTMYETEIFCECGRIIGVTFDKGTNRFEVWSK